MKILGIDPGYGRVGWSVIEGNHSKQTLVDVGCLETDPKQNIIGRFEVVHEFMKELLEEFRPDAVAVEELYFSKNVKTAIDVAQARGVILLSIIQAGVPCFNYNPMEIKTTVAGYGKASKQQVQTMVKAQLKLKVVPKPDDAADACAVALTHMFVNNSQLT
jgi:crossover junction endodeoxyribonuclease RuvC